MKYRIEPPGWPVGGVLIPSGTIVQDQDWAKGLTIPINACPLDAEAHEAQLKAYPEHRYLLRGGWEDK